MRQTKVLLALTYILVLVACLSEPPLTPAVAPAPVFLTEAETQPWSALSETLLN